MPDLFSFATIKWAFTGCLQDVYRMCLLCLSQTAGEVHQNANVLSPVRQHDGRVRFRQPDIREWSKYRCHEHAGRGLAQHQCAVLILSHLAVTLSSSHVSPAEGAIHHHLPPTTPCPSSVRPGGVADDEAHILKKRTLSPHPPQTTEVIYILHPRLTVTWRVSNVINTVVCPLMSCACVTFHSSFTRRVKMHFSSLNCSAQIQLLFSFYY